MHIVKSIDIGTDKINNSRLLVGLNNSDTKLTKTKKGVNVNIKHI